MPEIRNKQFSIFDRNKKQTGIRKTTEQNNR